MNLQWLRSDNCAVALDTRHDPIVISTWSGSASSELIDHYFAWSDATAAASMAAEQQLIHVADLSQCAVPAARVCKR